MKRPRKGSLVSIPVYAMDQAKGLPGVPVPDGCTLADLPRTGERGSIIWKKLPGGGALVDYDAMQRRDEQLDKRHQS